MSRRRGVAVLALLSTLAACPPPASSERLPVRTFTAADGLGSSFVSDVTQDAAGYLWFATRDGLSRWNGYEFTTLTEDNGFAVPAIDRVRQVRSGEYLAIGNDNALYSYFPSPREAQSTGKIAFRRVSVQHVGEDVRFTRIYEDGQGVVWGGGHGVLVKGVGATNTVIALRHPAHATRPIVIVHALREDQAGSLWIGTNWGLFRLRKQGTLAHYSLAPRDNGDVVGALAVDGRGRLWIGHSWLGLVVLNPGPADDPGGSRPLPMAARRGGAVPGDPREGEAVLLTTADGLPDNVVASVLAASDGQIWVGTRRGLARFDGRSVARYTTAHGLCDNVVHSLSEDADGHLWVGTPSGAMRIVPDGFVGYTTDDGLGTDHLVSFGELPDGSVYAVGIDWSVSVFDGRRFTAARMPLPAGSSLMWASQAGYRDRAGRWWALAHEGLHRFEPAPGTPPAFSLPARVYTARDGLRSSAAFRIYQDRAGSVWVGTRSGDPADEGLARFDTKLTRATPMGEADGLDGHAAPSAFAEDSHGNLWIGFYRGGLARCRDGRFQAFTVEDGVPKGMVTALLADGKGRLWIATNLGGVGRVDDPARPTLAVRAYTTRDGLGSNNVRALAEDREGRIVAGTARGVDRLDPATGHVRRYGLEDGLLKDFVTCAFRDSRGDLWFGTYGGAFRLGATREREESPPPIAITGLRIAGESFPVAELGQPAIDNLVLEPHQQDIAIDFVSVSRRQAQGVSYQYTIDATTSTWSLPSTARTVTFVRLSPGEYRFAVRAVTPGGKVSPVPATVTLTVKPPLWQRWWAILLAGLAVCTLGAAIHRHRVRQLLETERVRLAIASDLHDEVATNLSSIAMFSTLVRGELAQPPPLLDRITVLATESVAAIREIIWSIDPRPETVASLVMRLRDTMVTSCHARGMNLVVSVDGPGAQRNLTPEQRKNLWLMLKEAVTNAVKHSGATELRVAVAPEGRRVRITVRDNGAGCDTSPSSGRGLKTMTARAEALGGTATFLSAPGEGTTVEFRVRLAG